MAASDVEICNSALSKLGAEEITALTDNTRRAKLCNRQYDKIRKKLLRSYFWGFARKRAYLPQVTDASTTVNSGTDTFTSGSTLNMDTGDIVTIDLVSGALPSPLSTGQTYYAIKLTTTTFQLADNQADAANGIPLDITNAPTFSATFKIGAPFEYGAKFALPSDYLRGMREEYKSTNWRKEGQFIFSDEEALNIIYVADVTDTTLFDPSFDELFATALALELSYPLVQSMTLKREIRLEYVELLKDTRSFDSQEGLPEEFEADVFLSARN